MRIGIFGQAINIEKENLHWSIEDTVFFTVKKALADAGLAIGEIDTVIQAGDDVMDGIAINHVYTIEASGAFLKEESKVERDGAWAVHYAMARLLSGRFQTAMVVAFSKASQLDYSSFTGMTADPFYLRPIGVDGDSAAALQANYFLSANELPASVIAQVAAKNKKNGINNPRVMPGEAGNFSPEQIGASPMVSTPLTQQMCAQSGDGCVVLLLATEEYIKKNNRKAAWITGVGMSSEAYYPTYRALEKTEAAKIAFNTALEMSGTTPDAIQLYELHERYAHQELMLIEGFGICKEGNSAKELSDGRFNRDGQVPVNASGGVLCGDIVYGSGLARLLEASLQVRGEAGEVQVQGVKNAVAHAQAGLAMQAHIVYVLES